MLVSWENTAKGRAGVPGPGVVGVIRAEEGLLVGGGAWTQSDVMTGRGPGCDCMVSGKKR